MKTAEEKAARYANEMYQDENEWGAWYDGYIGGYNEAMRWRNPKEELPDEGVVVFVKILSSCEAGDEILYTSSSVRNDFYHSADADPFGCEGYYPSGNGGRVRATVIGWRPIE